MRWIAKLLCGLLLLTGPMARSQEMATLAQALDICAADTGYYVSLETLNDIPTASTTQTPWDGINNEGGTYVIRPNRGRFEPNRVNLVTATLEWRGPYVNYQPGRVQTTNSPYDRGSPLDPWGTPYWLFSPLGLVRGDTGAVTLEYYADFFDRYTIVSFGPDGVQGGGDDLFYQFGAPVTLFAISSIGPAPVGGGLRAGVTHEKLIETNHNKNHAPSPPISGGFFHVDEGSRIVIRGTNFPTSTTTQVRWGNVVLSDIQRFTQREVELTLPAGLRGTEQVTLASGTLVSQPATLMIGEPPNRAGGWEVYK